MVDVSENYVTISFNINRTLTPLLSALSRNIEVLQSPRAFNLGAILTKYKLKLTFESSYGILSKFQTTCLEHIHTCQVSYQ